MDSNERETDEASGANRTQRIDELRRQLRQLRARTPEHRHQVQDSHRATAEAEGARSGPPRNVARDAAEGAGTRSGPPRNEWPTEAERNVEERLRAVEAVQREHGEQLDLVIALVDELAEGE